MLIDTAIIFLNIYGSVCAATMPSYLQVKVEELLTCVADNNADAFKAIFESITLQWDVNIIAHDLCLRGGEDELGLKALKYFVEYWCNNRQGPVFDERDAKEAFGHLFNHFQESNFHTLELRDVSPLHVLIKRGETSLLRLWIDAKMDVDFKNSAGKTALIVAIEMLNEKHVALLVDAGANTKLCDADGKCALVYALESRNTEIIVKLCEKVSRCDIGQAMASIFGTDDENFILFVINEIHVSIIKHKKSSYAPNNENVVAFSRWTRRLSDVITIWRDLLRHLYDSHREGFGPTPTPVLVHASGGRCGYVSIQTVGDLHRLVTPGGGRGTTSEGIGNMCSAAGASSGRSMVTQIAMMYDIALLGMSRMSRIVVNPIDNAARPRFEVFVDESNGEWKRYSSLLHDSSGRCAATSDACDSQYPPPSCHSGPCRGLISDNNNPLLPADHRLDGLRHLFDSMPIGSASAFTAPASHDTPVGQSRPIERSMCEEQEESMDCSYRCISSQENQALSDSDEVVHQLVDTVSRHGGVFPSGTPPESGLLLRADSESDRARGDDAHADGTL